MDHTFAIKSSVSDAELAFTEREGDYFTVELRGREASAVRRVWGYTDCDLLVGILSHLATQEKGWSQPAEWFSIEQELILRFSSDVQGHVFIGVELSHCRGGEDWRLKAEIQTELGQMPTIAHDAAVFFRGEFLRGEH